jgi:hypothetical protein
MEVGCAVLNGGANDRPIQTCISRFTVVALAVAENRTFFVRC